MRKEASLPVRLDPEDKRRLQKAADALGTTVSALIRLLVRNFAEEYERNPERIVLPPRWTSSTNKTSEQNIPQRQKKDKGA